MAADDRIGDVRGRGLMVGVEFVKDRATREPDTDTSEALIQACAEQGLLVLNCGTHHNVIRFLPPDRRHGRGDRHRPGAVRGRAASLPHSTAGVTAGD